jgi:AcrR family transcriptional regulator
VQDTGVARAGVGLTDEQVVRLRCARIEDAVVEVAVARGCSAMTVDDVAVCGGLSRRTFYELYDDKTEALFAAYAAIVERVEERVRAAAAGVGDDGDAGDRVAAGLAELLHVVATQPTWARFCVIEAQTAGALAGDCDRHLRPIVASVRRAHAALGIAAPIPPVEQVAMILGVLRVRLSTEGTELGDLLPRFFALVTGEPWAEGRPELARHRSPEGDPARATAIAAAAARGDQAALRELVVVATVRHDRPALAAAAGCAGDDIALAAFVGAAARGGALAALQRLGLAGRGLGRTRPGRFAAPREQERERPARVPSGPRPPTRP